MSKENETQASETGAAEYIDITPTWAEWAMLYARLAESGETKVCAALRKDLLTAARAADAMSILLKEKALTDDQMSLIAPILADTK